MERSAAREAARRAARAPGGVYPFLRAAMCIVVRDLIVEAVITDIMSGRPAVYATFSSYDEVAHHSGLERADTLEALRKLDHQFGRIARACRYAPRPYEIVVLSDHGQTRVRRSSSATARGSTTWSESRWRAPTSLRSRAATSTTARSGQRSARRPAAP